MDFLIHDVMGLDILAMAMGSTVIVGFTAAAAVFQLRTFADAGFGLGTRDSLLLSLIQKGRYKSIHHTSLFLLWPVTGDCLHPSPTTKISYYYHDFVVRYCNIGIEHQIIVLFSYFYSQHERIVSVTAR